MKKKISLLLAVILLFVSGCSSETAKTEKNAEGGSTAEVAMGRYIEETIDLSKERSETAEDIIKFALPNFLKMADGSFGIDYMRYAAHSENKGETWTWNNEDWFYQFSKNNFIIFMQKSTFGEYLVSYVEDSSSEEEFNLRVKYLYIDETGTEKALQIKLPEEGKRITNSVFLEDGTLILSDTKGAIYECNKADGSLKELRASRGNGSVSYLTATSKYIIASDYKGVSFYNRETKEVTEDTQLNEFLKQEDLLEENHQISKSFLVIEGDNEESLYIACKSGVYNHVIGGNVMEKVIDGRLTSLGDLTQGLCGMLRKDNGDFLILYTNGKLMNYNYRKDIPTVPQKELKIFSLGENQTVAQAVNLFQKENQDVYVNYEIGIDEKSGADINDIIKNVNMEWLAGDGADIYILDGLERKNYERKGMLSDLSHILENSKEEYLDNITHAFKTDAGIFAVPVRFDIPMIVGEKNDIANISDMQSMIEEFGILRNAGCKKRLTSAVTEREFIRLFANAESDKWLDEEGKLNEKEIISFLNYVKKAYDMDMQFYNEGDDIRIRAFAQAQEGTEEEAVEKYITNSTNGVAGYIMGRQQLFYGNVSDDNYQYGELDAIKKQNPKVEYKLYGSGKQYKYLPKSIVGINAMSQNKEMAEAFLETLLRAEVQMQSLGDGLSIHKEAYQKEGNPKESMASGFYGDDGSEVVLDIPSTTRKQRENLYTMAEQLNTPIESNSFLLDIILELSPDAINGKKEVANVVEEIKSRMQIRLAE